MFAKSDLLELPQYPEYRGYLSDPTEAAYISDIALGIESDLDVLNTLVAFDDLDLTPNAITQIAGRCGLEANRLVEAAKRGYYIFKNKAKQFVNYVFAFFLEFLRGSTDTKAVFKKCQGKIEKYLKALTDLRVNFDESKKIEIRDVRAQLFTSITTVGMITANLDIILNKQHDINAKNDMTPQSKIIQFCRGITTMISFINIKNIAEMSINGEDTRAQALKNNEKQLLEILSSKPEVSNTMTKDMEAKLAEVKKLYSADIKKVSLSEADAYNHVKNLLQMMNDTLVAMEDDDSWDFKAVAAKVKAVQSELMDLIDGISNDEQREGSEISSDFKSSMKFLLEVGTFMAKTKDVIAVSLKTFKENIEIALTESQKVGSLFYSKKQ